MEKDQISLLMPASIACSCALALGFSCGPSSPERDASSAVCVYNLEVSHLLHKDEPHVRRFSQLQCWLPSALHRHASEVLHPRV